MHDSTRTWSPLQERIFKFVTEETGNGSVEAVAGSGKTTTIVEAANRLPREMNSLFLAFNKSIAEELGRRLPPNVAARTLNSLGHGAWTKYVGSRFLKLDSNKTKWIVADLLSEREAKVYGAGVRKLVGLAKSIGLASTKQHSDVVNPLADADDLAEWEWLVEWHDIDFNEGNVPLGIELAREVLDESIQRARRQIDFDDQLYMTVICQAPVPRYDFVFVDEAQDLNAVQHALLKQAMTKRSRLIAVGDPHQCQPTGTMILVPGNRTVPVETLNDGDKVVSVDFSHSCFKASGDSIKVGRRGYSGLMVSTTSASRTSRYTPNHRCVVCCKPLKDKFAVYLMQRGAKFRIGCTQFGVVAGVGVRTRMLTEKADALWILSLHDTKQQAVLEEALLSYSFRIPDRTFVSQTSNDTQCGLSQSLLDKFWDAIPDLTHQAANLLSYFGRNPRLPLISRDTPWDFAVRRPSEIYASNLMPGMLVLHDEEPVHYKKHQWKPIDVVSHDDYSGDVYSLEVANGKSYVADGIATHNSIYGFRGADSDSMENLIREFAATRLPLTISYRCPQLIVAEAQRFVSHIQAHESAPQGIVGRLERYNPQTFEPTDAILCRTAKYLISMAFKLIRSGVVCRVLGREIGQGLVTLTKKMNGANLDDMLAKLDIYTQRETERLLDRGLEEKAGQLDDKVQTIYVFVDQLSEDERTIEALIAKIEGLFSDNNTGMLTLCTVHKSKGLEWDRVFILNEWTMPSRWALQAWQKAQETNIQYVAITRAKRELYYIDDEGFRASGDTTDQQAESRPAGESPRPSHSEPPSQPDSTPHPEPGDTSESHPPTDSAPADPVASVCGSSLPQTARRAGSRYGSRYTRRRTASRGRTAAS